MYATYLKAEQLIGYRIRTWDDQYAALRDLVINTQNWSVPYLSVEAEALAPRRQVLVPSRSLLGLDEALREISVELTGAQLRESPSLDASESVTRDFEEQYERYYGWENQWRSEIDAESVEDPPQPVAPPADEAQPQEADADFPGLLRFTTLINWQGRTSDGVPVQLQNLLLDDSDWSLPYLEIELINMPIRERCLVESGLAQVTDPVSEFLQLGVDIDVLRRAPLHSYPAVDEQPCGVRILETSPGR